MTRKILLIILVLMLTLSSVAFVACDKDLDPFDIRQFYGEYSRNESMDPCGAILIEFWQRKEGETGYQMIDIVHNIDRIEGNGYWYYTISTQELEYKETDLDARALEKAANAIDMFGTDFQLSEGKLVAKQSNTVFYYDDYSVGNIVSGERLSLHVNDWNSLYSSEYPRLEVIIGYDGAEFNPKYAPKVITITYVDYLLGNDNAEYRYTIKFRSYKI